MMTKINGETPFQVLSPAFSISPSNQSYVLNISADGKNFSPLFSVASGVTRLVSNVAPGSYYKLAGNASEVIVNWRTTCVSEGGGGASGTELQPVSDFPADAAAGTVIAYSGSSSAAGVYQYDGTNWNAAGGEVDLSAYWTSAETQSAITAVEDHLYDVEEVTASALTELHTGLLEVSARTVDLSGYYTSAQTDSKIASALTAYTPTTGFSTINGSAITNGGNLVIQGGGSADMTQLQPVSELPESAETGTVMALAAEGLPEGFTFELGTGLGYYNDRSGGTLTVANNAALGVDSANPIYLFSVNGVNVYAWECEWDSRGISLCFGEPDNYRNLIDMAPEAEGGEFTDVLGDGTVDVNYPYDASTPGYIQIYNAENEAEPTFELPVGETGVYQYDGSDWASVTADMSAYYTSAQTEQAITSKNYITSAQADTQIVSALTQYTPTSGFSTINGSAITSGGNIEIQGGGGITSADVKTQIEAYNYMDQTDAQVISTALNDLEDRKVESSDQSINNIIKIEQSDYDWLVTISATTSTTLYVVVPDSN